ncbi:hypothetical protein D3C86_2060350 [compost metagenome]
MNRRVDIVIQEGAPKPALTPRPEASVDTLAPVFGDPNDGRPANPFNRGPGSETGGAIPNPFGNNF